VAGKSVEPTGGPFEDSIKNGSGTEWDFIFPEKKFHKWQNFSTKKYNRQFNPYFRTLFG